MQQSTSSSSEQKPLFPSASTITVRLTVGFLLSSLVCDECPVSQLPLSSRSEPLVWTVVLVSIFFLCENHVAGIALKLWLQCILRTHIMHFSVILFTLSLSNKHSMCYYFEVGKKILQQYLRFDWKEIEFSYRWKQLVFLCFILHLYLFGSCRRQKKTERLWRQKKDLRAICFSESKNSSGNGVIARDSFRATQCPAS